MKEKSYVVFIANEKVDQMCVNAHIRADIALVTGTMILMMTNCAKPSRLKRIVATGETSRLRATHRVVKEGDGSILAVNFDGKQHSTVANITELRRFQREKFFCIPVTLMNLIVSTAFHLRVVFDLKREALCERAQNVQETYTLCRDFLYGVSSPQKQRRVVGACERR